MKRTNATDGDDYDESDAKNFDDHIGSFQWICKPIARSGLRLLCRN